MPVSIRVWATSAATANMIVETRNRCSVGPRIWVTAIHAANATAACPDGSPPRSGVAQPFEDVGRRLADLAREDQVTDGDRVHRGDQDGAGGDVLRQLRQRVE